MGHFRQLPKGFRGMGENIRRRMIHADLDDLAAMGNRAMRRFAKKKLAKQQHQQQKQTTK